MSQPPPDTRQLRRVLEQLDETRKLLRNERMRSAKWKHLAEKARATRDAKPAEQRAR